jgi:phenylacetate-coenzyme A ligase PaaK-like adenylate-forming protein
MLAEAFAQIRFAISLMFGVPFDVGSLERLAEALRQTRQEFGAIGGEAAELLAGPSLDESTRRDVQLRRFRAQAVRGARETAYYGRLFAQLGLDPARLPYEEIARIPPTPKEAVRERPDDFVGRLAEPALRTVTTGTTGLPTAICFSRREMRSYVALGAISLQAGGLVDSTDVVQLSTSARATLGNTCFAGACELAGALVHQAGLVTAEHTLGLLAERRRLAGKRDRVSVLSTYPSHLGEVVELGLRQGLKPADFGLRRLFAGGELVTEGVKARARQLFGEIQIFEGYGMTETWPLAGLHCPDGHLHFEPSQALVEVLDLETGAPAGPGQAGTIVATPFRPYRETTILLRYDTRDVVRALPEPPTCALRHRPATGVLEGKLSLAARHDEGWTFPRQVLEALEALDEVPLPARCGFWAVPGGVAVEVVTRHADRPAARRAIERALGERGVPVRDLRLVSDRSGLRHPLPLRGDLCEATFDTAVPAGSPERAAPPRTAAWGLDGGAMGPAARAAKPLRERSLPARLDHPTAIRSAT